MAGSDQTLADYDDMDVDAEEWHPEVMKLLPGENPDSLHVRDALGWIQAYRHLQRLSDTDLSRAAHGSSDHALLEDEALRVGARLRFWKSRRDFLSADQRWTAASR
jgi:hypothetical protein